MMSYIYQKFKYVFIILTVLIINFGMIYKFYDITHLNDEEHALQDIIMNAIMTTLILPIYMYFTQALQNIDQQQCIEANRTIQDNQHVISLQNELKEIFDSLQEGILVIKNNKVTNCNKIFRSLLVEDDDREYIDQQIFKLYRCKEEEQSSNGGVVLGRIYSLRDLISQSAEFLNDKIFETVVSSNFKFVVVKMNNLRNQKLLI